ncbi:MAG: peptide chain release factor 1 [Alphaproteobacteria bacterium]|nr:peptide chain release factor 1 [Alphaproteobacteria bacterium]
MSLEENLNRILLRHEQLGEQLLKANEMASQDYVKVSKEYADLNEIVSTIKSLRSVESELQNIESALKESGLEAEFKEMMLIEKEELKQRIPEIEFAIKIQLLPKDEADERNAILEVRAGTGGDEAALFAADLLRMYQRFAEIQGWKYELLEASETGIGGIKEATATITGRSVFAKLKYESGVHRVQRVPDTETSGRIHTSAATVAVLPEAEEVDIHIDEKDLRIDVFRSSGPGGQHVNTTDSAVRITHLPTGVVVAQQDEKSQHKNKAKAMKILRARLYEEQRRRLEAERAASRKTQIGSGDRSERIRTYNFPQGRVTDHRIGLTLYKLEEILNGNVLHEMIDALIQEDQANKLADIEI